MTPEQELLRNAYLAEMWPTCREHHNTGSLIVEMLARPVERTTNGNAEWHNEGELKRGRPVFHHRATSDPPTANTEGGLRDERRPDH